MIGIARKRKTSAEQKKNDDERKERNANRIKKPGLSSCKSSSDSPFSRGVSWPLSIVLFCFFLAIFEGKSQISQGETNRFTFAFGSIASPSSSIDDDDWGGKIRPANQRFGFIFSQKKFAFFVHLFTHLSKGAKGDMRTGQLGLSFP